MAEFVIVIPNAQVNRAVNALCALGGYAGDPDDREARREHARAMVAEYIRRTVLQVEREQAVTAAMSAVVVDSIDVK